MMQIWARGHKERGLRRERAEERERECRGECYWLGEFQGSPLLWRNMGNGQSQKKIKQKLEVESSSSRGEGQRGCWREREQGGGVGCRRARRLPAGAGMGDCGGEGGGLHSPLMRL